MLTRAGSESALDAAFADIVERRIRVVIVQSDSVFNGRPELVAVIAARHKMPAVYPLREYAVGGGLMSYGTSLDDAMHRVGNYVGRILNGESPADLPVQQSVKVELVLNLRAAKSMGITFPLALQGRADEVIE